MTLPQPPDDLYALFDAAVEGTLDDPGRDRLQSLVLTDPLVRRLYVQYAHQHAQLLWHQGAVDPQSVLAFAPASTPVRSPRRWFGLAAAWLLLLSASLALLLYFTPAQSPAFATLLNAGGANWAGGSLPTQAGSRLAAGRLALRSGLATIRFDSGAELTLEGQAELELVDAMHCVLHRGALVAQVPDSAVGFVVDTPKARLVDQGTSFGVSVDPDGLGRVQVFEGIVDVQHRLAALPPARLTTGRAMRFETNRLDPRDDSMDEGPVGPADPPAAPIPGSQLSLTPAEGRGADLYIKHPVVVTHDSDSLLLLKNPSPDSKSPYARKIYLRFDLSALRSRRLHAASLHLALLPTGWGFASLVGEPEFALYGLTDESLDHWNPQSLDWSSAPANLDSGAELDPAKVRLLATLRLPAGLTEGRCLFDAQPLTDFLQSDTNGLATLILVRLTPESRTGGIVHGFASTRHPSEPPPTLRLSLQP